MRPLFEPRLVNGVFGDPALYVDLRDQRRALLFDLGDLASLPPRKLLRVGEIFVTHTHVDHFIGFDHLLRVILGRKARLALTGGPGFIAQIEHKLQAYTWNVVDRYDMGLVLDVTELDGAGHAGHACFSSRRRFAREDGLASEVQGDLVHADEFLRVRARLVDHGVPCVAYAVEEAAHVNVWKNHLLEMGLDVGPWLKDLRRAVLTSAADDTPITAAWVDRHGEHRVTRLLHELQPALRVVPGQRIGYVTDLRYSDENVNVLRELLSGVDVLFIESVFLHEHVEHAQRKNHLTARQAGSIARQIGARAVASFHFSPRYEGRGAELQTELAAAWSGVARDGGTA